MSKGARNRPDFKKLNHELTRQVVGDLNAAGRHAAVLAEAPPGAGKSTLTASVAAEIARQDGTLTLPIVTQTNEQADDLVRSLAQKHPDLVVARLVGTAGPSSVIQALLGSQVLVGKQSDHADLRGARVVVSTARKWQFERSRMQQSGLLKTFPFALIDEAYQMRSDMLLGIADLYDTLFCVGDPGQLDPFTTVDDSLWKGLPYSPTRTAMGTLREFHPGLTPIQLPTSWRLPPSAAAIVARAFYPFGGFDAGTGEGDRAMVLGRKRRGKCHESLDLDSVWRQAATLGWSYVELAEKFTVRTDMEIAGVLAALVCRLLERRAELTDELSRKPSPLRADRVAVIAAHNDQVQAVRYALHKAGQDPDALVVSTANKIQGREYDVVLVWHPLAGRRDATAFHLEAGRMCVMLSRHRHACVVVGRGGADRLLSEFPDSDPIFLDEPEKFPDGWEANHLVLNHLATHKAG